MAQFNLCFRVAFLAVLLPLTSGGCVDFDLGMENGAIPDNKLTASTEQSANTPAKNSRLNYTSGSSWCAATSDTNPYLQIDLQILHIICAVSTQGNSQADQWVKTYTLQLSTDGTTWTNYKELVGQVKVLEGNKDRNSNVKHVLYGVLTRYLRFLPQTHQGEVCMRTEVFGVQQKPTCDSQAIGLASGGRIPDDSFSASSIFVPKYAAKYGRLNGTGAWEPKTNTDPDDYLQIDLLYEYVICAVATQGNPPTQSPTAQEWTTEYKLRFSLNGTTFFPYKENKTDKAFPGNSGKTDTVKNSLKEFASAKFIRFLPTKYNRFKVLRVEAYGILLAKVPSQPPTVFNLTASSSTSIAASWQLPPVFARHGRSITGFKLFYKKKGFGGSVTTLTISSGSILSRNVTGLDKYTEYEFQVLAFTSDGDGPKSPVEVERTKEAAPSKAPRSFRVTIVTSTIITASWQLPPPDSRNGIIIGFKLFYKKRGSAGRATTVTINNGTALGKDVTGLDIYTEYEFEVLAFTSVGDGPRSSPLVVVITLKDGCVEFSLGMEDGRILDTGINASSCRTPAKNGRLNYASGSSWCAGTSDTNPYLQIDLQTLHIICAVSTQGNSKEDQWVKTYTLQLSTDGITWTNYTELGGQVKVLMGNDDKNSEVKHVVYEVLTRYLRFRPQTHQGGVCMRTEVFGVKQKPTCDSQAIGLASGGRIPDDSFSASSIFAPRYAAKYGRLNGTGAWEAKTNDHDDYLQIDLLYEYVICAVATQGNPPNQSSAQEWTKEYKLRFSFDGTTFFPYKENKTDKSFPGNLGKTDTVKNSLKEFASAKFIRFLPTKYNKFKVLRVEAYGILLTKVPSKPPTAFQLTASSSTSITASWQLPPVFARHGNITGFKLFYKKKGSGGSATTLYISDGATLSRTVSGLDKYTEYVFQVLAFTSDGNGPKSYTKVKRTMEDAPSQPPSNFNVTPTVSTGVTASWRLPPANSRNGIIKGFKLFYKRKDSSGSGAILLINSESTLNKNINGLYKYTEYEFQVLAFTSAGDGVNSSVVVKRTKEDVPSQPPSGFTLAASTSTSIIASWQLPPEDSRNGIITGYKLFYKKKGSLGPASMQPINGQATRSQEVTGLDKYTEYEFQILASTSVGDGPKSTVVYEKTKEAEPSRGPEEISSCAVSSAKFNITWLGLSREVANGMIINYEVRLSVVENCTEIKSSYDSTINTTTTYVIVTGLSLCAKYEVSIRGYTAVGPGPYSNPVMVQTLAVVWSKETPSSPSFSANSDEGGISVKVTLPRFPGNARFFQVIIVTYSSNYTGAVNPSERFTTQDMMTYEEAHKSAIPAAYVAFQFGGNDFDKYREFVVGDGADSSGKERSKRSSGDQFYYNKPLQPNTNYKMFLRAFDSETVYVSSNFIDIDTKGKPIIKGLPKTTVTTIGELAVLTCEVSGDPQASVTWTKDGLSSIPRAQFENNEKILIIRDVVPDDSGVYECKAMNMFGKSRTATIVIVAVPPRIIEEFSPSSVICEKQSPCFLTCQATSYIPFNYSWTKDGQVPTGDGIKLMNNSIIVTPRDGKDYGEYVCHATNSFGSTEYKITLLSPRDNQDDDDTQSTFLASVIAFSCIVVVLLIIICGLIWQRRRVVPNRRTRSKEKVDFDGVKSSPDQQRRDQPASDPDLYMELKPRPSNQESHVPTEYQSLQENPENPEYYNMVLQKENGGKQNEVVYEELC